MNSKRGWMILWAVISVMWLFYWFVITLSTSGEHIQEMIAEMDGAILLSALFLSLPMALYSIGSLVAWLVKLADGDKR
jgi:hypothetical protein